MKICITNGNVILKEQVVKSNVYIENDTICEISNRVPTDEKIIDAKGQYVSPGFIDLHTHGRGGSDSMYTSFGDINTISKATLQTGVTSFLPTTMTMSVDATSNAIQNIAAHQTMVEGSRILGVHMEGPFFNMRYKGAQPEEFMIAPTSDNFNKLSKGNSNVVKKLSLAPELQGANELIEYLVKENIVVSMGHTNGTYEDAKMAIEKGATSGTHTFNAMTPLTHRNPGVVGAIMEDKRVYAELILDGIHVSYPAASVLLSAKGDDKVVLITDSIEASGLQDGEYKLGNQAVFVKDGSTRLQDGTLAGSILAMNKAVYNAYKQMDLPIYTAVKLASLNPATSLHRYDIGEIAINKKADIILFDEEININLVMLEGIVKIGE